MLPRLATALPGEGVGQPMPARNTQRCTDHWYILITTAEQLLFRPAHSLLQHKSSAAWLWRSTMPSRRWSCCDPAAHPRQAQQQAAAAWQSTHPQGRELSGNCKQQTDWCPASYPATSL